MRLTATISNKFDSNDYRISILPVRKHASIPISNPLVGFLPKRDAKDKLLGIIKFDNIIFEAAVFSKKKVFKPLFIIELDDIYSKKITEEEFTKFIHDIIANEKIDNLINSTTMSDTYKKYGFSAIRHDIWYLLWLSKIPTLFIKKVADFTSVEGVHKFLRDL